MPSSNEKLKSIVEQRIKREEAKDLLIKLSRVPSPQTVYYEREPMVQDYLRDTIRPFLENLGLEVWQDDLGNVICEFGEGSTGKRILYLCYSMTWTPGTMKDPFTPKIEDGAKYGLNGEVVIARGTSENRGQEAATLLAIKAVVESGERLPGRIIFVESSGGHCSNHDCVARLFFNDEIKADWCLSGKGDGVRLGNWGRVDVKLNIWGEGYHSGFRAGEKGLNAMEGALEAITRLQKIMPYPASKIDSDMPRPTLQIINIKSFPESPGFPIGSGGHATQKLVRILLDRRLYPDEDAGEAIKQIKEAIGDLGYKYTVERGAYQWGYKLPKDHPVLRFLADGIKTMLGREPKYAYRTSTIDYGYITRSGLPVGAMIHEEMKFAHSDYDLIKVDTVYETAKVYAYLMLQGGVGY